MNVRLIASKKEHGVIRVYPLLCMDCEGDVFQWQDSFEHFDWTDEQMHSFGTYGCVHCGLRVTLDEKTFLAEATDERHAWLAGRHVHAKKKTTANDTLNESVSDPSAFRE